MEADKKELRKQDMICRAGGIVSGLLLATPHFCSVWAPLQAVALLPVFFLCASGKVRSKGMLVAGFYMALAYTLPQMVVFRLPTAMTLILIVWMTILLTTFTWASSILLAHNSLRGAFAAGALLVVLDWVNFTVLPIWGTAQSFVRPWSAYPRVVAFESVTGMTGIIFALGTFQAILVLLIMKPRMRTGSIVSLAVLVLAIVGTDAAILAGRPTGRMKVAAIGWTNNDAAECGEIYSQEGFETLFAGPAARAVSEGAALIVTPELGFQFSAKELTEPLEKFQSLTSGNNVILAIGYLNFSLNENRVMFISPSGRILAEHVKTYLTIFENFNPGAGRLVEVDIGGITTGAMICQDDNFTKFSREYGRRGVSVVAVPTYDWSMIKRAHLQNSIHRAIESRYAIVRAAVDGISVIVSPTGEVLARKDHFEEGPGGIFAEVPVYSGRTLFSILGHWPVIPAAVGLVIYAAMALRQKSKPRSSKEEG